MSDIVAKLRLAAADLSAANADVQDLLSTFADLTRELTSGGGPHGPVPPKQAWELVVKSNALQALVHTLHGKTLVFDELNKEANEKARNQDK